MGPPCGVPGQTTNRPAVSSGSPLSESDLVVAFEHASTPKIPYLQPYLRELNRIDDEETASNGVGETVLDFGEKEQERIAVLEVIDQIELDVLYHLPVIL